MAVVAAGSAAIGLGALATDVVRGPELDTIDLRFQVRGTQEAPASLLVVHIDDKTFDDLNTQWPFDRSVHGDVIRRISAGAPRAIGYDVQFTEPTEPAEDESLIDAVADAGPGKVVLATSEVDERGGSNVFGGEEVLREIGARAGNTVTKVDPGGSVRRYNRTTGGLKSFSLVTAEVARGGRLPAPSFQDGSAYIDFRGPPGTIDTVSFSDVLRGKVPPSRFRDRIVVVGASAPTLQDLHATPTSGDGLMSGAELQANGIYSALQGNPLEDVPWPVAALTILALALAVPLAALRLRPLPTVAVSVGAGGLLVVLAQVLFNAGEVLPVIPPLITLALATAGTLVVHYTVAAFERERIRGIFARFVPEAVVDEVLARADEDLRLGGDRRECTVMFTDLRGFTSFSEQRAPDVVIDVLNRYMAEMSGAIMDRGGTLVAYIGDGIMAVFGAPLDQPDHADRAVDCAREMLTERLPRFNEWMRDAGYADGFEMGIGLNTGPVMVGNVGSERRMEFTAIGDTTNTASRLEGLTKETEWSVFLAESTRAGLRREREDLVAVGDRDVRGRERSVAVWTIDTPVHAEVRP